MTEQGGAPGKDRPTVLIFGATGTIGIALCQSFSVAGWHVIGASRSKQPMAHCDQSICWDINKPFFELDSIKVDQFDAVVWAQGINLNDNIRSFSTDTHREVYEANVLYILESLQAMLDRRIVAAGTRLCVISSIWQNIARQNKLSYCVTKSALTGLVRSISIDLGPEDILINAVLPGPLDTPMTRANLSPIQMSAIIEATPLMSMPQIDDVCSLVRFLCSASNSGITGQFIAADRGYSHARII